MSNTQSPQPLSFDRQFEILPFELFSSLACVFRHADVERRIDGFGRRELFHRRRGDTGRHDDPALEVSASVSVRIEYDPLDRIRLFAADLLSRAEHTLQFVTASLER